MAQCSQWMLGAARYTYVAFLLDGNAPVAGTELPGYPPRRRILLANCPLERKCVNSQVAPCNAVPSG